MKKRFLVTVLTLALLILTVVPALAQSGIRFNVRDSVTSQPWGTVAGQSYRIIVTGLIQGTLLDTGLLTTPGDPVLEFTCDFGAACPPGSGTILGIPDNGEWVSIQVLLDGTSPDDASPDLGEVFVYNEQQGGDIFFSRTTGTGPTAVSLQQIGAGDTVNALPLAALAILFLGGATIAVLRSKSAT